MLTDPAITPALLITLFTFAAVNSITPGPNNIMLMVSGVNFGVPRTVPQMAGIFTGLLLINLATGFGLGLVFSQAPLVRSVLMALGVAYVLWLAWKIASAGSLGGGEMAHPLGFVPAFAFQWINPKLWIMSVTAVALYVRPGYALADTLLVTGVYSLVNIPAMLAWAGGGALLREALQKPARIRLFNIVMAVLLVASVAAILRR